MKLDYNDFIEERYGELKMAYMDKYSLDEMMEEDHKGFIQYCEDAYDDYLNPVLEYNPEDPPLVGGDGSV